MKLLDSPVSFPPTASNPTTWFWAFSLGSSSCVVEPEVGTVVAPGRPAGDSPLVAVTVAPDTPGRPYAPLTEAIDYRDR